MFRRSSVIIAASLAVLSTLEPTLCFAAAAPAQPHGDLEEKPRFIRKNVKRFVWGNSSSSYEAAGGRAPFGFDLTETKTEETGEPSGPPTTTEELQLTITSSTPVENVVTSIAQSSVPVVEGDSVQQPASSPSDSSNSNSIFQDQSSSQQQTTATTSIASSPSTSSLPLSPISPSDSLNSKSIFQEQSSTHQQTTIPSSSASSSSSSPLSSPPTTSYIEPSADSTNLNKKLQEQSSIQQQTTIPLSPASSSSSSPLSSPRIASYIVPSADFTNSNSIFQDQSSTRQQTIVPSSPASSSSSSPLSSPPIASYIVTSAGLIDSNSIFRDQSSTRQQTTLPSSLASPPGSSPSSSLTANQDVIKLPTVDRTTSQPSAVSSTTLSPSTTNQDTSNLAVSKPTTTQSYTISSPTLAPPIVNQDTSNLAPGKPSTATSSAMTSPVSAPATVDQEASDLAAGKPTTTQSSTGVSRADQSRPGSSELGKSQNTDANREGVQPTSTNGPGQFFEKKPTTNTLISLGSRSLQSSSAVADTNTATETDAVGQNRESLGSPSVSSPFSNGADNGFKPTTTVRNIRSTTQSDLESLPASSLPNDPGANTNTQNRLTSQGVGKALSTSPAISNQPNKPVGGSSLSSLPSGTQTTSQNQYHNTQGQQPSVGSSGSPSSAGPSATGAGQLPISAGNQGSQIGVENGASKATGTDSGDSGAGGLPLPTETNPQPVVNPSLTTAIIGAVSSVVRGQSSDRSGGSNGGEATDMKGNAGQTNAPVAASAPTGSGASTAASSPTATSRNDGIISDALVSTLLHDQLTNAVNPNTDKDFPKTKGADNLPIQQSDTAGGFTASITSNSLILPNPQSTQPNKGNLGSSIGNVGPSVTSNGILVPNPKETGNNDNDDVGASVTSNGIVVTNPQAPANTNSGNLRSKAGNVAASVISNGMVIPNTKASSNNDNGKIAASVTSDGVVIPNLEATSNNNNGNEASAAGNLGAPVTNSAGNLGDSLANSVGNPGASVTVSVGQAAAASIASNGVVVLSPTDLSGQNTKQSGSQGGSLGVIPSSKTTNLPQEGTPASFTGENIPAISNAVATNTAQGSQPGFSGALSASITDSTGVLVPNPAATVSDQDIAAPASVTLPNESVVPNPVATVSDQNIAAPASVTLPNESVVPNPVATVSDQNIATPASVTLSNKPVVPNPGATTTNQHTAIPASVTLPNGSVVPNPVLTATSSPGMGQTNPATGGVIQQTNMPEENNATLLDESVVPVSQSLRKPKQPQATELPGSVASSTLANSDVVPIIVPPSPGSIRPEQLSAAFPTSQAAGPFSTTLPNGQVVPIASAGISGLGPGDKAEPANTEQSQPVTSAEISGQGTGDKAVPANTEKSPTIASAAVSTPTTGEKAPPANAGEIQASVTGTVAGVAQSQNNPAPTAKPVVTQSQVYPSNDKGPFTQNPTSYDDSTVEVVPTSILYLPSSFPPSPTSGSYGPTGLPSDIPLVLYPTSGPVERPDNTDAVQIGFFYPLNYKFVLAHEETQKQIFTFLPRGIAYGLGIDLKNVTMDTLRAWDTTQDLFYITTIARCFIPRPLVGPLGLILRTHSDRFYNNPEAPVRTLIGMVNSAIPIHGDNETDGGTQTVGSTPSSSASSSSGAAPVGGNIANTSPVKASSVVIGVGVVCGAVAYGGAMFFVARRYKKRRLSHMRSPSMFSSPVMSHAGPDSAAGAALMSGAMGGERSVSPYYDRAASRGSGRTGGSSGRQQISAPVMAENSLGWN
ncbi:MAG: hypothetical protein Q9217_003072 [Psora testacea]